MGNKILSCCGVRPGKSLEEKSNKSKIKSSNTKYDYYSENKLKIYEVEKLDQSPHKCAPNGKLKNFSTSSPKHQFSCFHKNKKYSREFDTETENESVKIEEEKISNHKQFKRFLPLKVFKDEIENFS